MGNAGSSAYIWWHRGTLVNLVINYQTLNMMFVIYRVL